MIERLNKIIEYINELDYVKTIKTFELFGSIIKGAVAINVESVSLMFDVEIFQQYPYQFHDSESIRFINSELLEYNHVNRDGSICVHTLQSIDLAQKISFDLNGLKHWIIKYYINKEQDNHYEHIVVPYKHINGIKYSFLFTEVDYTFKKGQFGFFNYSELSKGVNRAEKTITNIVCSFNIEKNVIPCKWSEAYLKLANSEGIFVFIEKPPIKNKRFAIENWVELEPYVDQSFFDFLYALSTNTPLKNKPPILPLFIGYKISSFEIHWQSVLIQSNDFPNYGVKANNPGRSYLGKFQDKEIIWAETKNISYKYFFGRGTLHKKLTSSKILIIGIGAIGSILASTLVRGGCTNIYISDYDLKEPENVCRSEYLFLTGITEKVQDLSNLLIAISPFVSVTVIEKLIDYAKYLINDSNWLKTIENTFNEYDIVFDCTADNDLAHIFDLLNLKSDIFNISITNHAKNLVCVVKPNIYQWMIEIFKFLQNDIKDLYNPTGCWSPTFKATYSDVNTLVQYAIKHINYCFERQVPIRNFHLSASYEEAFMINMTQL